MSREIRVPYQNYEGKYSIRYIQPLSLSYKDTEWHGECWHLSGYDLDKNVKREFDLEKIIRGTVEFTLKSIGACAHDNKIDGIMNKINGVEF